MATVAPLSYLCPARRVPLSPPRPSVHCPQLALWTSEPQPSEQPEQKKQDEPLPLAVHISDLEELFVARVLYESENTNWIRNPGCFTAAKTNVLPCLSPLRRLHTAPLMTEANSQGCTFSLTGNYRKGAKRSAEGRDRRESIADGRLYACSFCLLEKLP